MQDACRATRGLRCCGKGRRQGLARPGGQGVPASPRAQRVAGSLPTVNTKQCLPVQGLQHWGNGMGHPKTGMRGVWHPPMATLWETGVMGTQRLAMPPGALGRAHLGTCLQHGWHREGVGDAAQCPTPSHTAEFTAAINI